MGEGRGTFAICGTPESYGEIVLLANARHGGKQAIVEGRPLRIGRSGVSGTIARLRSPRRSSVGGLWRTAATTRGIPRPLHEWGSRWTVGRVSKGRA